ncbi:hypothetical protein [Nocardia coubleae]|uniref:Uncharacterized protein n=1 Tax=Nocardia coubleae TaxID=356147 RepID=A0A846W5T7_9NOCA|nr:hypothetical protein [Nocardia coubleae]NKX87878.1 hypothetical protein [Nocardia coubleae]
MGTTVESAQLPAGSDEDRLVVTDGAVIVLDGATAHDPAMPSAGAYVDFLAADLARSIGESSSLAEILARSIARAVDLLGIEPGLRRRALSPSFGPNPTWSMCWCWVTRR